MIKGKLLVSALLFIAGTEMAGAQTAYTYVQQNGTAVAADGTAAFDVSASSHPSVEFVDGKAVMTINGNTVATLPMSDGGQLAVDFSSTAASVSKTVTNGYATLYSPFQLQVPSTSDVKVYAPTYEAPKLMLKAENEVAPGAIIPAGTGLILKNNGTINFTFSADASTDTHVSALSGSALTIEKPVEEGKTVYTLGHESTTNEYGFFAYIGDNMNPGLAYLLATTLSDSQKAKYVSFCFDDEGATAVNSINDEQLTTIYGKFIENGRVVIVRNGQKYNLNGQEVK